MEKILASYKNKNIFYLLLLFSLFSCGEKKEVVEIQDFNFSFSKTGKLDSFGLTTKPLNADCYFSGSGIKDKKKEDLNEDLLQKTCAEINSLNLSVYCSSDKFKASGSRPFKIEPCEPIAIE